MKKRRLTTILLVLVFLAGLSLLLYPSFSNYWNSMHQSHAISQYTEEVANLDEENYEQILEDAKKYNQTLLKKGNRYQMTKEEQKVYESLLNISGSGVMGYIEIPKINCTLPLYHGTDEAVLQIAAGHIAGTSLPVGGEGTHCVLSGHRGLPSARLFTDIDKLAEGDTFVIQVLNETLTYEVDKISIVLPQELEALEILQGKDLCTLVTCTPYGVNTHRLLVRGHRVENLEETARVTADALQIEPVLVAPLAAVPMLLILLIILVIRTRKRR